MLWEILTWRLSCRRGIDMEEVKQASSQEIQQSFYLHVNGCLTKDLHVITHVNGNRLQ